MNIKVEILNELKNACQKLGYDVSMVSVAFSNRPELADFQSNFALALSKQVDENPFELAEKVVKNIKKSENFEYFVAKPGFINVKLTDAALSKFCNFVALDKHLGVKQVEKPRLVFFDYGGANVAKELHVGHLRSPIVGEALKRLHKAVGNKTLSDAHLGDYGLQMGLTILQLKCDGFLDAFFEDESKSANVNMENVTAVEDARNVPYDQIPLENITLDVLNEEYPKASKRKDVDEVFKKEAEKITLNIQQQIQPYFAIYQKLRSLSVKEIQKNYEMLNATFDFYYGESDANPLIEETVQIFVDKGLARESDGALVVDVAQEGEHVPIPKKDPNEPQRYKNPMPPAIIKKHNGGDLYATTDIATILMRNREFAPDEIVYVTDNRQVQHFTQVFRCCRLAGISPKEQKLTHVPFGTMNGQDGKPFKTRAGETIKLKDVVNLLIEKANEKLASNGIVENAELARKIGVGAMKFGDLSNTVSKDYVFDIDKFLSFDGKTGPYIQYTIARINSILSKAGFVDKAGFIDGIDAGHMRETNKSVEFNAELNAKIEISTLDERAIAISILKLNSAFQVCSDNYSLNALCLACFDLASAFSGLYNNQKILSEQNENKKQSLLSLCLLVKKVLENALWVLGIDSVEKM